MMNELKQTLGQVNALQTTENGALGYSTSGQELVDLNFRVPGNHNNVTNEDIVKFCKSLDENPVDTIKWLFYLRDVREGLGERDSFIVLFRYLVKQKPEMAIKVLWLIPEFGRWKDLIDIFSWCEDGSVIGDEILNIITNQLKSDCQNLVDGKPVSLLAKWMPSVNATVKARNQAKRFCTVFGLSFADYRKMLSKLRKYIDVTEVKTCGNQWNEIDYNKVSSNANSRYLNAFMRHDGERRQKYLDALSKPEVSGAVMHASNLYPYEVYAKYGKMSGRGWNASDVTEDPGVEALWKNLKNIDAAGNTMVIVDGSGSMETYITNSVRAIDVSRSLGVFFSERCEGEFKDKMIEFSETPQYIDLSGCKSLADKFNVMREYDDCSNTDLERVFDLILKTAIDHKLPQSELPERLLIVSDMEFDWATKIHGQHKRLLIVSDMEFDCATEIHGQHSGVMSQYQTLFRTIQRTWDEYGYKLPKIVFWNVDSITKTIPVSSNEAGITLVSGFSVNNIKMILSGEDNPWSALKSVLDSDRYKVIETALNS